ncbi:hypothetical protein NEDG_00824 [Nematocida displodere]|uniref:U3 small nucleolar RNA-associated protein 14 n=1 Tax=Nematocida displodere TaxID=1805483 RepID=A0A177EDV8_9MICR|nr:hypothetical protein NEDG_00824 [Nematocida displodere]
MDIRLSDLIPESQDLVEKETLFLSRAQKKPLDHAEPLKPKRAPKINPILDMATQTELEHAIARIRYTQEEIELAKEHRQNRIELSRAAVKNAWSKKIKSKSYRKSRREDKQRVMALRAEASLSPTTERAASQPPTPTEHANPASQPPTAAPAAPDTLEARTQTLLREVLATRPVDVQVTFTGKNTQEKIEQVEKIFDLDKEFIREKETHKEKDMPTQEEVIVPGWNEWGGESIRPTSNSTNTTTVKRTGIEVRKRKDFNISHVIYNERGTETRNPKYGVKRLPYGYADEEEYQEALTLPLTKSHQPLKLFKKLIREEKDRRAI